MNEDGNYTDNEYRDFLMSRPLSWWREYMRGAYQKYEGLKQAPITKEDKHALWQELKHNHRTLGIGSFTVLAIMRHFKEGR